MNFLKPLSATAQQARKIYTSSALFRHYSYTLHSPLLMQNHIMTTSTMQTTINHHLDTQGLICPEPVMMLHRIIRQAEGGEVIEILATDPATTRDIPNFCRHLGHELLKQEALAENVSLSIDPDEITVASDDDAPLNGTLYRYLVKKKDA